MQASKIEGREIKVDMALLLVGQWRVFAIDASVAAACLSLTSPAS
jgi:hypothetical protein